LSLRLAVYTLFGKNKIKFGQKYSASPKISTPVTCGVILHAHPVRGESHIQRNANREVAVVVIVLVVKAQKVLKVELDLV